MKERDNQRSKLYKAEREALEQFKQPVETVKDIERYLKRQFGRATLIKRYGKAVDWNAWPIEIHNGRGHRRAVAYGTRTIAIPLWARKDWVILHEAAHIIHKRLAVNWAMSAQGTRTIELTHGAGHGWQFAAIYLDLVRYCMSKDAADTLKASFRKHKVRFTKPQKRKALTPEQREALRDRMARARQAKTVKLAAWSAAASIARRDFGASTIAKLAKSGITIIGTQAIPDMASPMPYANASRGYVVNDNGTCRVLSFNDVRELI